jgi:hypothetical protein
LLLSVLWLLLLTLRLSMLLLGLGLLLLALLLLGMVLLCALLVLLCVRRSSDSEKKRQNGCAGDSNYFHRCYLQNCWLRTLALVQSSCCRVAAGSPDLRSSTLRFFCRAGKFAV